MKLKANFSRNLNFSPSNKKTILNVFFPFIDIRCSFLKCKTSVLSNNGFAKETSFSKVTNGHVISCQEKHWCPKALPEFPPRKDGIILPPIGLPWYSPLPPLESVWMSGQVYTDVRTKISGIDRLPNLLTHGAPPYNLWPQRSLLFTRQDLRAYCISVSNQTSFLK